MKRKSIIALILGCIGLGALTTSCEDMLSPDSERHSYTVAQDTLYSYWGILRSLQNVGERYVVLGECRGDLVSGTTYLSDSISTILNFDMEHATDGSNRYLQASDYYHVINSCNAYMANCDTIRKTGTLKPYMTKEYAQVCAIRAWVYLQLVQVYGEVPFYTEPLLTTDDINTFMAGNHQKANADNLAELLSPELENMYVIEQTYGFPQYDTYGQTSSVCHSQKCMIPIALILGDLYLTKGDKASCEKAAQWYYNYFSPKNDENAGGPLPTGYYSYGYLGEGMDKAQYSHTGTPWTEKEAWEKNTEAITAIPSSTNKLWGTVQRGVNELFGFTSVINVSGDSASTASVKLEAKYDAKQLRASDGYYDQCKAVPFEYYIAANQDAVNSSDNTLAIDTAVGDARRSWIEEFNVNYGTTTNSVNKEYFITKQNPGGAFTTVYPMIYRKSMVWLRFAEALNRAGYPSYAFAILKNGLCNNDNWLPDTDAHYAVKDTIFEAPYISYKLADGIEHTDSITLTAEINHAEDMMSIITQYADNLAATLGEAIDFEYGYTWAPKTYFNYPDEDLSNTVVCNYISRQERLNSEGIDYLNLKTNSLFATSGSQTVYYRISSTSPQLNSITYSASSADEYITTGIHYHGAGLLKYDEKRSVYNYVDKIIEVAKKNYGKTLTKDDIYDEANQVLVQDCVEDLIVNEEAMELAFEGTRFFDLMRVAHRRGDASYLAERVSKRDGQKDASLYSKLLNTNNWYFPLPQK